jgi:hypothetical protein
MYFSIPIDISPQPENKSRIIISLALDDAAGRSSIPQTKPFQSCSGDDDGQ